MLSARQGRRQYSALVLVAIALGAAACGGAGSGTSTTTSRSTRPSSVTSTTVSGTAPLVAPATSALQDGQYLTEVTEADPSLTSYEEQQGNVALRALLTDGSAFCALLQRGGGIDSALVGVADGARGDEAQTHLPLSVTTFNAVEAVALLTLCPSEQALVPASVRSRIRKLGAALGGRSG